MSNICQRAAQYFGMEQEPRTTVMVGRYKVIVVVPHGKSRSVGIYSEELSSPKGEYLYFDGGIPDALIEALR